MAETKKAAPKAAANKPVDVEDGAVASSFATNAGETQPITSAAEGEPEDARVGNGANDVSATPDPDAEPETAGSLHEKAEKLGIENGNFTSENFTVEINAKNGQQLAYISPRGWVGDAPLVVHVTRLAELKKLLASVK